VADFPEIPGLWVFDYSFYILLIRLD